MMSRAVKDLNPKSYVCDCIGPSWSRHLGLCRVFRVCLWLRFRV